MTNYKCSAIGDDNRVYDYTTIAAGIVSQALDEFNHYIIMEGGEPELLQGLSLDAIDDD